jgi:hypothetical protein
MVIQRLPKIVPHTLTHSHEVVITWNYNDKGVGVDGLVVLVVQPDHIELHGHWVELSTKKL